MEFGAVPGDLYAGYVVEDSDLEYSGCSDEGSSNDDDGGCSITDNQTYKRSSQDQVSSEDEFEKEMASEVLSALEVLATPSATSRKASGQEFLGENSAKPSAEPVPVKASKDSQPEYYDEVYFDSDCDEDEETEVGGGRQEVMEGGESDEEGPRVARREESGNHTTKVRKLTNDELFYDPTMDDKDEKWIKRCRMAYHNVEVSQQLEKMNKKEKEKEPPKDDKDDKNKATKTKEAALPKSDASLNCPACMVTLCLDCQRHDIYVNQYRAMFVLNCCVLKDEVLKYIPRQSKRSRKRHNRSNRTSDRMEATGNSSEETIDSYHPVRCSECNTEVAVMDSDEVFHFFNVLASAPS